MEFLLLIILFAVLFNNRKLSDRVRKCEEALSQLKLSPKDEKQQSDQKAPLHPVVNQPPPLSLLLEPRKKTFSQETVEQQPMQQRHQIFESFQIPNIIKENWMGVFGSVALVIGAVFFGLTAEIMQHAEVRVGMMIAVSFLFLGVSQKLKNHTEWIPLCGWLKSIAGTVILFATLGAGGIEGLQFIHSPLYGLYFLCFGISINIILAMTTPSEKVASLHVILSILAFCIVPQSVILLPIGAIVASIGLISAYRSKWDLHLILIVMAFTIQNTIWTFTLDAHLLPWMHDLAIGSSVAVSLIAACIHYSKKYHSPKLELLPLIAHISNWALLTWNIWIHVQFFKWTPLLLGSVAVTGFILARIAKKKEIDWLYHTDTLLSQLVAMSALASMHILLVKPMDLGLLILCETLVFNCICLIHKENFLIKIGYCLSSLSYLVIAICFLEALSITPIADQFPIYLRMGLVTALSWGFYIYSSLKNYVIDDFRFLLFGRRNQENSISIMMLFGTIFLLGIYFYGFNFLVIQATVLSLIGLVAIWRKFKEDSSWNITFIITLFLVHVLNWSHLADFLGLEYSPSITSKVDFVGLFFLDLFLVFGNLLQLQLWKKNISKVVIYALGIHVGLLTYLFTEDLSILIPSLVFLGLSILALEAGRKIPVFFTYSPDVKLNISEGMTHVGFAFLIAFLSRFVAINLQIDPIWHGISLRWITEAIGLLVMFYWIAFYPREDSSKFTQFCGHCLVEGCVGFITLCVFTEVPEMWRPSIWAIMAIVLLIGSLNKEWPERLFIYSWMYLMVSIIHVTFVTSNLTMPKAFLIEQNHIAAVITIVLQVCFAYIVHRSALDFVKKEDYSATKGLTQFIPILYRQPSLTVILPIFLEIALLFAFNFEKTILTLLWVGLTCFYLAVGLLVQSKRSIQIAMLVLAFCSIRLILFDLVQSDLAIRALVFIGVGSLMLGISVLYKKYKHRIEVRENA